MPLDPRIKGLLIALACTSGAGLVGVCIALAIDEMSTKPPKAPESPVAEPLPVAAPETRADPTTPVVEPASAPGSDATSPAAMPAGDAPLLS